MKILKVMLAAVTINAAAYGVLYAGALEKDAMSSSDFVLAKSNSAIPVPAPRAGADPSGTKAEGIYPDIVSYFKPTGVCAKFKPPMSTADAVGKLGPIGNAALRELFYCDLPNMGEKIQPASYEELLKTEPYRFDWSRYTADGTLRIGVEYWDVRWAYGFDVRQAYLEMLPQIGNMPSSLGAITEALVYIKKEFPAQRNGALIGWSSFGYNKDAANWNPTLNSIRPQLLTDLHAKDLPVMMMNYAEPPWYSDALGIGVLDFFRFLSKDIVIAQGADAAYDRNNAKMPKFKIVPFQQQFWMERKRETRMLNLGRETVFLSVPMLKWMWDYSSAGPLSAGDLSGKWDADLIMNAVSVRAQSRLNFEPAGKGLLQSRFGGKVEAHDILSAEPSGQGLKLRLADSEPSLTLKQVAPGVPVLVGRRCIPVDGINDALLLGKWVGFLPAYTRKIFMAQYLAADEAGRQSYCLHYLLRKSAL